MICGGVFLTTVISKLIGGDPNLWVLGIAGIACFAVVYLWDKIVPRLSKGKIHRVEAVDLPKPYDFPIWDAIQYVLTDTAYGVDQQFVGVRWDLLVAAREGKIRVWARPGPKKPYEKIKISILAKANFISDPVDQLGRIEGPNNSVWFEPIFAREEVEGEFSTRLHRDNIT